MFDKQVGPDTRVGEKVQVALLLIKQYEDENYLVPMPDPIEAIKSKMKDAGLRNKDLVGKVGVKGISAKAILPHRHIPTYMHRLSQHNMP